MRTKKERFTDYTPEFDEMLVDQVENGGYETKRKAFENIAEKHDLRYNQVTGRYYDLKNRGYGEAELQVRAKKNVKDDEKINYESVNPAELNELEVNEGASKRVKMIKQVMALRKVQTSDLILSEVMFAIDLVDEKGENATLTDIFKGKDIF